MSNKIIQLMFDTLITMDKDLNLLPGLAESWESVDPLNTIFHLKKMLNSTMEILRPLKM